MMFAVLLLWQWQASSALLRAFPKNISSGTRSGVGAARLSLAAMHFTKTASQ